MSETKLKVGFVGIGAMGTSMANNLLQDRFSLTVCDHYHSNRKSEFLFRVYKLNWLASKTPKQQETFLGF